MAMDGKGNFHLSGSKAREADRMAEPAKKKPMEGEMGAETGGEGMKLVPHGDGSYHTEGAGGEHEEHEDLGHALTHMAHEQEPDGKHMHIHHDGFESHSHSIDEHGEHDGTHTHDDAEDLKEHVGKFAGEEQGENDEDHEGAEPLESSAEDSIY